MTPKAEINVQTPAFVGPTSAIVFNYYTDRLFGQIFD